MAVGLVVAAVALAAGLYIASMNRPKVQQQDMSPNTIDSFKTTTSNEGSVVPMVWGYVRISSNLLWYGNLETIEVIEEVETGGKGGGGGGTEEVVVGYQYYMDLWLALCIGPGVTIEEVYANDRAEGPSGTLNPGSTNSYPTEPGTYARAMNPVAHVFFNRKYLGENVATVPTYHFVVRRQSSAPLTNANSVYGANPAAIIYDCLTTAGVPTSEIVLSTFQDACNYWHGKNYGLNITVSKQEEVRKIINRVFTYVDGTLRQDSQGRFELKAYKDTDTYDVEITEKEDFKKFTFTRRTWDDVYTDFRANFTDNTQAYTQRTVRVRNTAVQEIIGYPRQITIDLSAYTYLASASARLWEMMKRLSYPEARISCTVSLKYASYRVGDVVRINHEDYGIEDADFRITKIQLGKAESNEINWELTQMIEGIFDSNFVTSGGSEWSLPDYTPVAGYDHDVYELPYTTTYGREPAYLCLIARKGVETGFEVQWSATGTDYKSKGRFTSFSQHGSLDEEYPATTYSIDDETGILYTPDKDDPTFLDLARGDLFTTQRVAILGNPQLSTAELVTFQTVSPEGGGSQYRLGGVIRGLLNTPISTHSIGTEIWVTNVNNNVITGIANSSFYIKMMPYFGTEQLDASSAPAVTVTYQKKGETPWPINAVKVTRSGSTCSVEVVLTAQHNVKGAGIYAAESQNLATNYETSFQYWNNIATSPVSESGRDWNYTQASAHTLSVRHYRDGNFSDTIQVTVGAGDGEYLSTENQLTNTGLEKILTGSVYWEDIMARNANRLNDLLYITQLFDVDDSGIANTNTLVWNASTQKFEPAAWGVAFMTTTTSTTTTTSSSSTTSNTQSSTSSSTTSSSTTVSTASSTSTVSSTSSSSTTASTASTTTSNTASSTSSTTSSTASTSSTVSSTTTNTQSSTTSSTSSTTTTAPPFPFFEGEDVSSGVTPDLREEHIR
jgi:hypothetical protein